MCTTATANLIDDVIKQKVDNNELFTAFDVSLTVKDLAASKGEPVERHRQMKGVIHQTIEPYVKQGVYNSELWDVGAQTRAYLYYPNGADPNGYQPVARKDAKPSADPDPADADADDGDGILTSVTPDPASGDNGRKADKRGTVTVPNFILRQAGFGYKDVAYVTSRKDSQGRDTVVLGKRVAAGCSPITTYTVDRDCNVRVCNATFKAGGLDATAFDFERIDDEVIIRSH